MIALAKFEITNNYTHNIIHWEFTPETVIASGVTISIYRSLSPGFSTNVVDFELIASGLSVDIDYQDFTVTRVSDKVWYYKIKLSDNSFISPVPAFIKGATTDKIIKEIIRRKALSLNKYTARSFTVLKRRTWGEHCPVCWDDVLFRTTNPDCPTCFGTGWTYGYYTPIVFNAMINTSPEYKQILMFGEWKPSDVMLYMLNYPLISEQDTIIDDEGKRWRVIQKRPLKKLGYTIEQQVQLALIANDDIIYSVPIN